MDQKEMIEIGSQLGYEWNIILSSKLNELEKKNPVDVDIFLKLFIGSIVSFACAVISEPIKVKKEMPSEDIEKLATELARSVYEPLKMGLSHFLKLKINSKAQSNA